MTKKRKARSRRCERAFNWGGRTRTSNFLINSQAVCQLTYTPILTFDQSKPFPRRRESHSGQHIGCNRKGRQYETDGLLRGAGDGLLSRVLSNGVPSALQVLTTVFGMGTGVAPTLQSPAIIKMTLDSSVIV